MEGMLFQHSAGHDEIALFFFLTTHPNKDVAIPADFIKLLTAC